MISRTHNQSLQTTPAWKHLLTEKMCSQSSQYIPCSNGTAYGIMVRSRVRAFLYVHSRLAGFYYLLCRIVRLSSDAWFFFWRLEICISVIVLCILPCVLLFIVIFNIFWCMISWQKLENLEIAMAKRKKRHK